MFLESLGCNHTAIRVWDVPRLWPGYEGQGSVSWSLGMAVCGPTLGVQDGAGRQADCAGLISHKRAAVVACVSPPPTTKPCTPDGTTAAAGR